MTEHDLASAWAGQRRRLIGLAYRMTGSRADAEDLVQEAFVRLSQAEAVADPPAWLTTVVTRLSIDHLRLARVQRETYVGPWVPEPVTEEDLGEDAALAETVSVAMLVVMETMSPVERAAFLLHDVFGYAHDEVAAMLDRTPASVRQAAVRGRTHLEARRPRFEPDPDRRRAAGQRFLDAAQGQDLEGLMAVLSPDVAFRSDGGGVVTAARKVLQGRERVVKFLVSLAERHPDSTMSLTWVNAAPALRMAAADGALVGVMVLQVGADGTVAEINTVLNPEKLRGLV